MVPRSLRSVESGRWRSLCNKTLRSVEFEMYKKTAKTLKNMQEWFGCLINQEVVQVIYPSLRALDEGITVDQIVAREPIAVMFRQEDGRYTVVQRGSIEINHDGRFWLDTKHIFYYGDVETALTPIIQHNQDFYNVVEQYLLVT